MVLLLLNNKTLAGCIEVKHHFNPIPNNKIWAIANLKAFAGNKFNVACRYEQFLLFPQCFQKVCFPGASKGVIVWEWVKMLIAPFDRVENVGKGENAGYQHFLLFPQCFQRASFSRSLKVGTVW